MNEYLSMNRQTYDATAHEFLDKQAQRHDGTLRLLNMFTNHLEESKNILELGPGSGLASKLMLDQGYNVTAIEFSEPMSRIARNTAPGAKLIVDEFLSHDFREDKFDGIYAVAFIHLFPADEVIKVVQKIANLLPPNGIVLVSTTKHDEMSEGYATKLNFVSQQKRFRRQYDRPGLEKLLTSTGLSILEFEELPDPVESEKTWMNVILKKEEMYA